MRKTPLLIFCLLLPSPLPAQSCFSSAESFFSLTRPHDYAQKRVSSYDRTGGNADFRPLAPGATIDLLDVAGPGIITHIWITIASPEQFHLKKLVLRMYWDREDTPSVEAPIGDFFGLGLGEYFLYQSVPLAVAADNALNSFFSNAFPEKRAHHRHQ